MVQTCHLLLRWQLSISTISCTGVCESHMPNSVTCHFLSARSRFRFHISPRMMPGAGVNEGERETVALCLTQTQSQMVFFFRSRGKQNLTPFAQPYVWFFLNTHTHPKKQGTPSSSFSFENSGPFLFIYTAEHHGTPAVNSHNVTEHANMLALTIHHQCISQITIFTYQWYEV